jgi:uncharacterized protein (DUF1501 family)
MSITNPSRRRFLQGLGAMPLLGVLPGAFSAPAGAAELSDRVLVVVHLDGGCDGLNTVIPYADPAYAAARPNLAIAANSVLTISDKLGFHPAMDGLKNWYDVGRVALIQGVGYPGFVRSHFAAEDIYWTASPEAPQQDTGWLGRCLDAWRVSDPLAGASLESRAPKSMAAARFAAPAIPNAGSYLYKTPGDATEKSRQLAAVNAIFGQAGIGSALFDGILLRDLAAMSSADQVQAALAAYGSSVQYASDAFSQALKLAGQIIHADLGTRVLTLALGGFDTHANQAATLETLLGQFSAGIDSFMRDAQAGGFSDRVAILVWTEFGRRVAENASGGTDHGTAAPMFMIGEHVRGGTLGTQPSLTDLDNGDLKMAIDFRRVYASALSEWLGLDAGAILGGTWPGLGLFA